MRRPLSTYFGRKKKLWERAEADIERFVEHAGENPSNLGGFQNRFAQDIRERYYRLLAAQKKK